ncbi:hypothetical protein R3W88_007832 [Solanum pinnatisectum]|uniref:Uncharacterized protein n=1 Tax=Solanum pinnatisectum TaxID=50273 RepID=A0AAV9M6A5_9SOLN|nr:hypothetical protein R3W88_007832 [Solanum pinnatisectum]
MHDQLAALLYSRREKNIQSIFHEDLGKELHNLRKAFDRELCSRNCQSLKYENLCVHSNVELPLGYKLPKFNTFNGKGNSIAHLRDNCSRLIGIGHHEVIQMRLFIQSLSGLALASKIHLSFPEGEFISTFVQTQEGLYYDKLLGTCAHNFFNFIKVGKEIENGIQRGRIVENSTTQVIHQTFQVKTPLILQRKMRENNSFMTMQQPKHHPSDKFLQSHATSNYLIVRLHSPCKQ